ncbi:LysR substrate-binding domain-containing protein [Crenobacter sp. SG2305]|uniref:LysR family transcriptional regulator n=1 Tax=Crenobacter oryzisoli TaxID=3056844 RepID=UPI0025AB2F0C|nr:LysR family transcriptional regulator [Crenobacter sp. SG2305]MDN0081235.1 LysR substrate-binding domain-containing protein [Crenobacter sp. SG2305]
MADLAALRLLLHIADYGSFAGAAAAHGLTPSSVTRQIRQLEAELGAALFHRTTRRVALSEAGQRYLPHARAIVAADDAGRAALATVQQEPAGLLRITAPLLLGNLFVVPALAGFLARYPAIRVELTISDERFDLIERGFDLGIREGPQADSSLRMRRLFRYQRLLCASPAYLAAHGPPAHPTELAGHACLRYRGGTHAEPWQLERAGERLLLDPPARLAANDLQSLYQAALAGCGISRLPLERVRDDLAAGRLVAVLPDWRCGGADGEAVLWAVFPERLQKSARLAALLDWLATYPPA